MELLIVYGKSKKEKLTKENARYLISIFTPVTVMGYTINFCQLNYIIYWFEDYIKNEENNIDYDYIVYKRAF